MFFKFRNALGISVMLSLIFTFQAFAGGWAVITLDELPTNVVAGEPLTVGFTVLQHGKTPMVDLYPTITARLSRETKFVVDAEPEGKLGHYTATLTFPEEGEWNWSIQAFTMDQPMPTLNVTAPAAGVVSQPVIKNEPPASPVSPLLIVRLSALGIGLAGLVVAIRRRSRLAVALTALCLVVGIGSFALSPAVPAVEAQSKSSSQSTSASSTSQIQTGQQLFIAKGCITCHTNTKAVVRPEYLTIDFGTNLSNFSASPEALRLRLKDPSSVKSDTQMPNLNLSEAEIEALIAFINSN